MQASETDVIVTRQTSEKTSTMPKPKRRLTTLRRLREETFVSFCARDEVCSSTHNA